MRAFVLVLALTACGRPICGGKDGQHCGCSAKHCTEPCSVCCDRVPCPVEGR